MCNFNSFIFIGYGIILENNDIKGIQIAIYTYIIERCFNK